MTQPSNNDKGNDAFGAFAGLVILIVILAILFILITPDALSNNDTTEVVTETEVVAGDEIDTETIVADEATEESVALADDVATEAPTEEPAAVVDVATEEPTEAPTAVGVATEEPTEEPTAVVDVATEEPTTAEIATDNTDTAYDPELVALGEQLFTTCAACHGADARGIVGLGKDLVAGDFATSATDEELIALITTGRPIWDAANTTSVDMPPKGGNPVLTGDDIEAIVTYIRTLQTSQEADAGVEATTDETIADGANDTEIAYDPELVALGEQLFTTCAACHGADARGIVGLGKDLVAGDFATSATDEELIALITTGRPIWDAANTTSVDMPPKGGNPVLTGDDIEAIVTYIRTLQTP
ncbi:MAG: c-type cytochrome [Anaerolineae bacterium]|nr:c-type cytochrome [Anaerolineae bacterium]